MLSPADLEGLNCNLVGGDIYAGSCALDQNLLWRPSGQLPGPRDGGRRALADRRLHAPRARASAPGSGYLVAKQLLRPPLPRRVLERGTGAAGKLRERLPL